MAKYIWEDPKTFKLNKEDGHTIAMPFDTLEDALSGDASKYKQSLNGMWKFFWQRGTENQIENFYNTDYDDAGWGEIKVPSVWQMQGFSVPYYYASTFPRALSRMRSQIPKIDHSMQEIGYYRRKFTVDSCFDGREIFLHFGACKAALEVWVNGEYVGFSTGSMTPHEFDVTKYIKQGKTPFVQRCTDMQRLLILRIRICGGCAEFTVRCICLPSRKAVCVIFM